MRALVRKYPINAHSEENNEVWFYPWRNGDEQGRPYTLGGYCYAMCENVPDSNPTGEEQADPRLDVNNYDVVENTREVPSEDPEGGTVTEKYWTATYRGSQ